jgi:signal transduction histidine kinase
MSGSKKMAKVEKNILGTYQLDKTSRNLEILYESSKLLNSSLSASDILDSMNRLVTRKLRYDYFSIYILEGQTLVLKDTRGRSAPKRESIIRLDEGITGYVASTGKPLLVEDVQSDRRYICIRKDVCSELAVPVKINDNTIGVLNAESRRRGFFTRKDLALMSALADQFSLVLNNTLTNEMLRNTNERLKNLNRIAQAANSTSKLEKIFKIILEYIKKEINYDLIAILLIKNNKLYSKAGLGFTKKELDTYSASIGEGICGQVARTGKPILANDVSKVPYYKNQAARTKSELSVPLVVEGNIIGVLNVESEELDAFSEDDLLYLTNLADQVSTAIHNAQNYEKIRSFNKKLREEVRNATKELVKANLELKRLNEIKTDFVSTVSHELRTPLTSIIGYATVLNDGEAGPLTGDQREFIGVVKTESERLMRLINDILDVSRIESGKMRLNYESFDLVDFMKGFKKEMTHIASQKSISLKLTMPDRISSIMADPDKIKQIFSNLVNNAVKFSPAGSAVSITATEDKYHVRIDIKDQGIGIRKSDQAALFKKFSRLNNDYTRETGGTGLGLAICDFLVKEHGGRIWVKSTPGEGSIFSFTLSKAIRQAS